MARGKRGRGKSGQPDPIPKGFRAVTPYLVVTGGARAIEFYKKAFGAEELSRNTMPDGKILNAQIKINDSILMLSDEFPGSGVKSPSTLGSSTVTIHVYTKDVDKLWQRAISAGAKTIMPLGNQFWGERYGQLSDPFGHRWSISSRIAMSPEESESKRKAAMVLFSRGNTPESRARPEGQPTQKPPRNKTQPDQRDSESTLSCRNQCSGSLHNANF